MSISSLMLPNVNVTHNVTRVHVLRPENRISVCFFMTIVLACDESHTVHVRPRLLLQKAFRVSGQCVDFSRSHLSSVDKMETTRSLATSRTPPPPKIGRPVSSVESSLPGSNDEFDGFASDQLMMDSGRSVALRGHSRVTFHVNVSFDSVDAVLADSLTMDSAWAVVEVSPCGACVSHTNAANNHGGNESSRETSFHPFVVQHQIVCRTPGCARW